MRLLESRHEHTVYKHLDAEAGISIFNPDGRSSVAR
jgi:hypothetical protein